MKRQDPIDPTVASLLTDLNRKQAERETPVKERQKKIKAREKAAARNRVMLDLPVDIKAKVDDIAKQIGCPMSQVATVLLAIGLEHFEHPVIDIGSYRVPSKSPRYEWNLDIPEIMKYIR